MYFRRIHHPRVWLFYAISVVAFSSTACRVGAATDLKANGVLRPDEAINHEVIVVTFVQDLS